MTTSSLVIKPNVYWRYLGLSKGRFLFKIRWGISSKIIGRGKILVAQRTTFPKVLLLISLEWTEIPTDMGQMIQTYVFYEFHYLNNEWVNHENIFIFKCFFLEKQHAPRVKRIESNLGIINNMKTYDECSAHLQQDSVFLTRMLISPNKDVGDGTGFKKI